MPSDQMRQTEFRLWLVTCCFDGQSKLGLTALEIALCIAEELAKWLFKAMEESQEVED